MIACVTSASTICRNNCCISTASSVLCRVVFLPFLPRHLKVRGCHQTCTELRCLENSGNQIARRGLTVCASDADGAKLLCWIRVEGTGKIG